MTIYIVTSFDEDSIAKEQSAFRILKAFNDLDAAREYMAECGYQVEQWDAGIPKMTDDDNVDEKNWYAHQLKHPFYFDDGHMASAFSIHYIELE